MPVISSEVSVGANAISANVLSGELYEFVPSDSVVTVLVTGAAAGLRATLSIGGEVLLEEALVNSQNRVPVIPDDMLTQEGAFAGDRLFLRFRNTTAAAIIARWLLKIDGVA